MHVQVFRLIDRQHAALVLDGASAALTGGRWNPRGTPVVYTSLSASLAILEMLSHYQQQVLQPDSHCLAVIAVPDDGVEPFARARLPPRWQHLPWATRQYGARWAAQGGLALRVPSAVHAFDDNLLLNPLHPRFGEVEVISCEPILLAESLFEQQPAQAR